MEALTREQTKVLVDRILSGDQDAGEEFVKQYSAIVIDYAGKWLKTLGPAGRGLCTFEDVTQDIWEHIFRNLKTYNSEKAAMTTWLYIACPSACNRRLISLRRVKNSIQDEEGRDIQDLSLNAPIEGIDDGSVELLDALIDPVGNFENEIMEEVFLYEKVYLVSQFVSCLTIKQQICYLHSLKKISSTVTANILGCTRQSISLVNITIKDKLISFYNSKARQPINYAEADKFVISLLSKKDDDILSEELNYNLATIKICRELLNILGLYQTTELDMDTKRYKKKEKGVVA